MEQFLTALVLAAISAFVAFLVSWGWSKRAMQDIEKQIDKHANYHKEHYTHAADTDAHWTPRERDALTRQIDRIEKGVSQLLQRSSGDLRPCRAIGASALSLRPRLASASVACF